MLKFNILDDYNFGGPYLLHPKSVFDENCWVGFHFKSSFCGQKFRLNPRCYEDFACILVQGGLVMDCIYSVKYGAFFTVARPFLDRRNFFQDFFCTSFSQDEVEQLPSGSF